MKDSRKRKLNWKLTEISRKVESEKKKLELRCVKLSKQVSDFEKIVISDRDIFDKERKNSEKKNTLLFKEIYDKNQNLEKDFEAERKHFESVISELSDKLVVLSTDIQKVQETKSEMQSKFDKLCNEKAKLNDKISQLEKASVDLSDKLASETPVLSCYDDDASESVCSFKSVDSLYQKMVFKKQTVKSEILKPNQIKPSSPFYVKSVDRYAYGFHAFKKEKMIWGVKGSPESVKYQKYQQKLN
ncbi:hypothetical protein L6452_22925 [Arctium lappa]|uniref:Uncharacterized protein n=1 Tax=Arctium lappa TaxID=4217 RepID=A0ACB9B1G9_ARCLA|nr:hypothetical protein L6452_22925 [Arctium lappa]